MLKIQGKSMKTGVVTTAYPDRRDEPPQRFRGRPLIQPVAADGSTVRFSALPDPSICPSGAISIRPAQEHQPRTWHLDIARCVFCGRCAEQPDGPVKMGGDYELAARRREDLVVEVVESRGTENPPTPEEKAAGRAALGEQLRRAIGRILGRSLHLRHLDAGSCNGCDWELTTLLNPIYDVQRLGIDFVASPRHADGVVVTGPVTRNLEISVRRTFEGVPEPRVVLAIGSCASSGGVVGRSYASLGGVGAVLPVDVFIPGCPPRPEAIIFGILLSMQRLAQKQGPTHVVAGAG